MSNRSAAKCCGGVPHRLLDGRRFYYKLFGRELGGRDEIERQMPSRHPTAVALLEYQNYADLIRGSNDVIIRATRVDEFRTFKESPPYEFLCPRGHWTTDHHVPWKFASDREADRMVQRLNAGLPVFRDRWLGIGAVLLVASSVVQAVAAVF